jgi:cellulose synthase/poly-beta-1,6-N-acetylglucosamine synthase-like glycosyltransferase
MRVSIIIPTQRRPVGLAVAVGSALAQSGVDPASVELIVADNDATPSAQAFVQGLVSIAPFPVSYLHVPEPGVANVRNAALAKARGEWIAFLDDDQEAPAGWLAALLKAQSDFDADVVFGPVLARAPQAAPALRAYLERFFSRPGPHPAGLLDIYYGCGDSLIRRSAMGDQPFAAERNQIGGEDDLLFGRMQVAGVRFAWAPDAWVHEDPAPQRQTLGYALARAFAYGQGPSAHCAVQGDQLGVARWMAIGVGQAVVYGAQAGLLWLIRSPRWPGVLDRAARGLGKTCWFGPFKIAFYGRRA